MKQEIRERIEKIRKGDVSEGYQKTKVGIIPLDWEVTKLKNVLKIKHGKSQKEVESVNGKYPILASGGIIGYSNEYIYNKPSVLIGRKGTIDKPTYRTDAFWTVDTLFYSEIFDSYIPKFIYYKFCMINWRKYNEASGVPSLNASTIESINISNSNKKVEQQKIAEILSTWDKAIELKEELIEEKKEFKRGLMQKLLVGKIRFKEHVKNPNLQEAKRYSTLPEDWSIKKARSIFSKISKKNNRNEQLLSATQNNGVLPRDMLDGDVMSPSGDTKSYKLVEEGDFVISLRSFQGGIEYSSYRGIISPAYTVLKNKIPICMDFYRYIFKSKLFIDRLASSVIGIRDGKQISYDDFSFMFLPYPELKEQEKIAFTLKNLDYNIELLNLELNQLKEQKRGLMQLLLTGIVRVEVN